jgi:heat shock protein HslJ
MKAVRFALLALVLAVAGCGGRGTPAAGGDSPLRGRTFLSTTVTEGGKPYQLAEKSRVRLQFTDDGRLIADAGCNTMQGPVNLGGNRIEVSDLATTGMGCPAAAQEQDGWLTRFLSGKPSWKLDGSTLVVTSPTTEVTFADRKVAEPDLTLQGTRWTVDTVVDGEVASSTPATASASLVFDKDTVAVSAGCNSGSGSYQLTGNTIRIGDIATTRKACEPDVMSLENAVLTVLRGDVTYEIDSDRLILKQPTGKGLQLRGRR